MIFLFALTAVLSGCGRYADFQLPSPSPSAEKQKATTRMMETESLTPQLYALITACASAVPLLVGKSRRGRSIGVAHEAQPVGTKARGELVFYWRSGRHDECREMNLPGAFGNKTQ